MSDQPQQRRSRALGLAPAAVAVVASAALIVLTLAVARHGAITQWDSRIVHGLPHPRGIRRLVLASTRRVANPPVVAAWALVLAGAWSLGTRRRQPIAVVGATLAAVSVGVIALKLLVDRQSPHAPNARLAFDSYPSGHTAMALVVTGSFCLLAWPLMRWWGRTLAVFGGACTVAAVAAAMIALRSHWPSDVLGSLALGCLVLSLGGWLIRRRAVPDEAPVHA